MLSTSTFLLEVETLVLINYSPNGEASKMETLFDHYYRISIKNHDRYIMRAIISSTQYLHDEYVYLAK